MGAIAGGISLNLIPIGLILGKVYLEICSVPSKPNLKAPVADQDLRQGCKQAPDRGCPVALVVLWHWVKAGERSTPNYGGVCHHR